MLPRLWICTTFTAACKASSNSFSCNVPSGMSRAKNNDAPLVNYYSQRLRGMSSLDSSFADAGKAVATQLVATRGQMGSLSPAR